MIICCNVFCVPVKTIGHVRYIKIPNKLLYLVLFSLYSSLFWELRGKRNLKNITFFTRKFRSHRTWPIERCFLYLNYM